MKIEMVMPQMGESIVEGTIIKWVKTVGDSVKLDEDILEISTDKVDSDIPSPATGTIIEIFVAEGETVPINTPLAIIETNGADVSGTSAEGTKALEKSTKPASRDSSPHDGSDHGGLKVSEFRRKENAVNDDVTGEPQAGKSAFLSPLVTNIAVSEGISLDVVQSLTGTGKNGRITKKDLLKYIEGVKSGSLEKPAVSMPAAPVRKQPVLPAAAVWRGDGDEIIEMDRMRRSIADHMVKSVHTSPHVVSYSEVDMNRLIQHRNSIKKSFLEREGINITFTSYFIHATAKAISHFPYVNASVDGYKVILRRQVNIGFAVELPGSGLIVPVIKGVDGLNLKGIAHGLNNLAEKARAGKLDPEDVSGGTFTVTNVGVFGNIAGAPIINQPQVAILGTGAIRKVPAVIETDSGDAIAIRWQMIMSLSYDHRLVDGAMAGRFMAKLKDLLENYEE